MADETLTKLDEAGRLICLGWKPDSKEVCVNCMITQIGISYTPEMTADEIAKKLLGYMKDRKYYGTKKLSAPTDCAVSYGYFQDVCIRLCTNPLESRIDIGLFEA